MHPKSTAKRADPVKINPFNPRCFPYSSKEVPLELVRFRVPEHRTAKNNLNIAFITLDYFPMGLPQSWRSPGYLCIPSLPALQASRISSRLVQFNPSCLNATVFARLVLQPIPSATNSQRRTIFTTQSHSHDLGPQWKSPVPAPAVFSAFLLAAAANRSKPSTCLLFVARTAEHLALCDDFDDGTSEHAELLGGASIQNGQVYFGKGVNTGQKVKLCTSSTISTSGPLQNPRNSCHEADLVGSV